MKSSTLASILLAGFGSLAASAQSVPDTIDGHRAAAKAAAGQDLGGIYNRACPAEGPAAGRGPGRGPRTTPPREQWYAEPVKVFDNFYWLGTKEHSSWAVTTSAGILLIDTLFDYATEPEIVEGLKKLGLDPAQIKYVVLSHGHGDHDGGVKMLQDMFHPHVVFSAADWDLAEHDTRNPIPKRDMVATDGEKLTLGDTTITLYITPGHTPGTISTLVPVRDNGQRHLAVEWGGTALSTATPIPMLQAYIKSAARFRDIAVGAGADVLFTNHSEFDLSLQKLDAVKKRKPGDPNPYVVGKETVRRYLTVAEECGKAMLLAAQAVQH